MKTVFRHFRINRETGELAAWFKSFVDKDGVRHAPGYDPSEKGGLTVCYLCDDKGIYGVGFAECSAKDSFCYKVGRKIALDRAAACAEGKQVPYILSKRSPAAKIIAELASDLI